MELVRRTIRTRTNALVSLGCSWNCQGQLKVGKASKMCLQPARPAHPNGGPPAPQPTCQQHPGSGTAQLPCGGGAHPRVWKPSLYGWRQQSKGKGGGAGHQRSAQVLTRFPRKSGSEPEHRSLGQTGLDGDSPHGSPLPCHPQPSSTSPPGPEPSPQVSTWCSQMPFSHESHTQKWGGGGTRSPSKGTSWVRFVIQRSTGRPAAATRGQHSGPRHGAAR